MGSRYTDEQVAQALAALELNGGNVKATARELNIPRATLQLWRDRVPEPAGTIRRDYAALWADAQVKALNQAITIAEALTEATPENLTALTRLAVAAKDAHLDYTEGRKGSNATVNVDNRRIEVLYVDAGRDRP